MTSTADAQARTEQGPLHRFLSKLGWWLVAVKCSGRGVNRPGAWH